MFLHGSHYMTQLWRNGAYMFLSIKLLKGNLYPWTLVDVTGVNKHLPFMTAVFTFLMRLSQPFIQICGVGVFAGRWVVTV